MATFLISGFLKFFRKEVLAPFYVKRCKVLMELGAEQGHVEGLG